jgi:hypothetical protein
MLVIIHALAVMAIPAGAAADDVDVTGGYFVNDCHQHSRWLSTANGTAFRGSLLPLLDALPSAAAPTGFASLRSVIGRASARGLCFGEAPPLHDCRECLSILAGRIDYLCKGSRRAGFWNAGCFLAYADTTDANASSTEQEEEFFSSSVDNAGGVLNYYADFYNARSLVDLAQSLAPRAANSTSGRMVATANATAEANSTVSALAQCTGDVTAADCARCLERSVPEVARCLQSTYKHGGVQAAGVVHVFRYNCYIRLEISAPMGRWARLGEFPNDPSWSCCGLFYKNGVTTVFASVCREEDERSCCRCGGGRRRSCPRDHRGSFSRMEASSCRKNSSCHARRLDSKLGMQAKG